ncbi:MULTISPECIES: hemolysin family protein [unclassified Coleofasciculus]|uniref:hemolysin family protein n=1 Tax=unclassified Coleofasciculus TaxID=2692782 RepID=UPI00188096E9|nr:MULTISPECIES: hemolysin family protein [unclassified Coleofasciculus]MBE9128241.1 HlyC/CorC family transporter [Coleofasciculus sp. LEGE 07081]MBE9148564.1 HlyC/CorC family transporter [Coleofasciculus sp. LEGE 07092]
MSSLTRELFFVFLLILLNGIFAMSEMAIVSARKVRLQQLANRGNAKARTALELTHSPNQFLSTVQIGITLIGILAGAFGGATIANKLATQLEAIPFLAANAEAIALFVVVLIITYFSLVLGELVPKRLALNNPELIATGVASQMRFLANLAAPAVHLLSYSTDMVLRLLGIGPSREPEVTEEEIKILIQQGTDAGMFEEVEQDIVQRVFGLGDRRVSALMTPRPDIIWLDLDDTSEVNRNKIIGSSHTRFPVCQGSIDNVLGVVQVTTLLGRCLVGHPLDLTACLKQPLFVPESTRALRVLELFKKSGPHLALVVDEYGVIQGLVTLNDLLEALVGDIPSVDDRDEVQAVQREDGSWLVDGMLSIDEFRRLFKIEELPGEQRGNYHTLGGFVITHLGRIPAAAEHFEWGGLRFEVMDMDGNRVDKVLVMPRQKEPSQRPNDVY